MPGWSRFTKNGKRGINNFSSFFLHIIVNVCLRALRCLCGLCVKIDFMFTQRFAKVYIKMNSVNFQMSISWVQIEY